MHRKQRDKDKGNAMNTQTQNFDPRALCSRKLWQLVAGLDSGELGENDVQLAISELTERRHYLAELTRIGKLENNTSSM